MASSSDWIAQAQAQGPGRAAPGWLDALGAGMASAAGFAAGAPFAASPPEPLTPPPPANDSPEEADRFAQAFADGHAAGRAEAEQTLAAQRALRLTLRELDRAALDTLAADLAETVLALCTQVIDEHAIDGAALTRRCEVAAARIGKAASQCRLRLNPADAALIETAEPGAVTIEPDPTLERGALVLEGPEGAVRDGPGEWRRAIAAALQR